MRMPKTKIELLEYLMEDLEIYRKEYEEEFNAHFQEGESYYLKNQLQSKVRRFARQLDLGDWNFNCYNKGVIDIDEDFDIIADEIRLQYVYEHEKNQTAKVEVLLDIARNEAEKEQNTEVINELQMITATEIINDDGNKFKRSLQKLVSPVGEGILTIAEGIIRAGTEGITTAILGHIK